MPDDSGAAGARAREAAAGWSMLSGTVREVCFGVFDHVDRGDQPLGALYDARFRLVEAIDAAGFRTYHVAEHHATPLGMAPSPGVYLAAVAQRTRRLRFGPLVYIVPLYHPLRLIEEICMLDHLSGGRFELGVGRGISPYELAYWNVPFLEAAAMCEEALEVILSGLRGGRLTYEGRYYRFASVPMELTPVQRPHPPLWQGVVSPASAAAAARRSVNVVSNAPCATVRTLVDAYFEAWKGEGGGTAPLVGMQRHVVVAETDAAALDSAHDAYRRWYESLTQLWRQFGTVPVSFADSLEGAIQRDAAIIGSPATVRAEVRRQLAATGANYFVGRFLFGTLPLERALRSIELFSREVMPALPSRPSAP
jgi:alkanesulfonate monooxygenase SsuD/methylene tetrahydromethanopterin reductase-like flavin-dependent oxidoreductase (luciferase family)